MTMIATTIINSIKVKPFWIALMDAPLLNTPVGAQGSTSKSHAVFRAANLLHWFYDILRHFLGLIRPGQARHRSKTRHSLPLELTGASRRLVPSQHHFAASARQLSNARLHALSSKGTSHSPCVGLRLRPS